MKVPFYEKRDKNATYENNDYKWVDLELFLKIIDDKLIKDFGALNAFSLNKIDEDFWKEKIKKYPPVSIDGDNFVEFGIFLIASKVLYTTGFMCEYGLWTKGTGNHHGIDLILPKNTPIVSFSDGEVVRIKTWDGVKKNEGNCVVIKSNIDGENLYFSYEHLETINVKINENVKKGQVIGTCGSTGNSTTYHLHFQIDNEKAPFHPFWSKNLKDTTKYCIDGWKFLQKHYVGASDDKKDDETDDDIVSNLLAHLENDDKTSYIDFFVKIGILKGDNGNYYLNSYLTRYQFTLILYRLYKKGFLKIKEKDCKLSFIDTNIDDEEFQSALKLIVCANIIRGENNYFYPWNKLTGEQFLAIIGRLFANLEDSSGENWYQNYLDWAKNNNIIDNNWAYINKSITRKEVLKILYKLLKL